jgi:hypothetical protein
MSGASLPAAWAGACELREASGSLGSALRALRAHVPLGMPSRVAAYVIDERARPWSRRRLGRSGLERGRTLRPAPFTLASPSANLRCAAPARCGAFADELRIVAGDEGAECGREVLIRPVGQCGSADGRKSGALLVKVTGNEPVFPFSWNGVSRP